MISIPFDNLKRLRNRIEREGVPREIAAIKADSDRVAALLPKATTTYHVIPDATHLSFMQICKEDGEKRLLEESPNEAFICRSGGGRDRAALHQEIRGAVTTFLRDALK